MDSSRSMRIIIRRTLVINDVAFASSSVQIFYFNSRFRGIRRAAFLRVSQNKNEGFVYELDAKSTITEENGQVYHSVEFFEQTKHLRSYHQPQIVRSSIGAGHIQTCVNVSRVVLI